MILVWSYGAVPFQPGAFPVEGVSASFLVGAGAVAPALDFESALALSLKARPCLIGIVGARIYPTAVPEDSPSLAKLVYKIAMKPRDHHLLGSAAIARAHVDFTALSYNKSDCVAIRECLRNMFDGFRGSLMGVSVAFAMLKNETDDYAEPVDDSDQGTHSKVIEFSFTFRESPPTG